MRTGQLLTWITSIITRIRIVGALVFRIQDSYSDVVAIEQLTIDKCLVLLYRLIEPRVVTLIQRYM